MPPRGIFFKIILPIWYSDEFFDEIAVVLQRGDALRAFYHGGGGLPGDVP